MTTEKLIEEMKYYAKIGKMYNTFFKYDGGVEKMTALFTEGSKKLEMAYTELKEQGYCSTCKYNNICSGEGDADTDCNGSDKWEWAGDEE